MNWLPLVLLISGCVATPIQQGSLQIVKYNSGRDGLIAQNEGNQQPIVWNSQQPIIMEPAPLTYGAIKGGSLITERDQQRHINVEDEADSREDVSDEEIQPENEPKMDLDSRDGGDVRQDDQRPVQTETAALLGSSIVAVKGGANQMMYRENEQVFPTVVSQQRRLIEPKMAQKYAIKGRSLNAMLGITSSVLPKQNIVYQEVQGLPLTLQQHKVSSQGSKRPVVQYELLPVQQQNVPREWLIQPTYQVNQAGVKGDGRETQYVIQSVIPSSINMVQQQPHTVIADLSQVQQRGQQQHIHQVNPLVKNGQVEGGSTLHVITGVQDVHKSSPISQKPNVKSAVQQTNHKVIIEETARHIPVVSGQRVIGYQLIGSQPQIQRQYSVQSQQQQVSNPQIVSPQLKQQSVQYMPYIVQQMPVSDQQYYQVMQSIPVQSYGQQDDSQSSIIGYPYQYSEQIAMNSGQQVVANQLVSQNGQTEQIRHAQGIQGVQQIQDHTSDRIVTRGQDLRVSPLTVNQRSHILGQSGVKGAVSV